MNINTIISIPIFGALDALYLNYSGGFFNEVIKNIQGSDLKLKIYPTILCYVFLVFALNYFIISKNASADDAFLLGLSIYAVYEFTNFAIIDKWPVKAVIMDTLWGGILFYLTTYLTYNIKNRPNSIIFRSILNILYTLGVGAIPATEIPIA
tara:strand:- start:306 stop:761 length:456 start_codon:yes stop_codon:yes gene_type:complete